MTLSPNKLGSKKVAASYIYFRFFATSLK